MDRPYSDLEARLGYLFINQDLLVEALTHPSFAHENPGARDNARLEFLGDAFLGFATAKRLVEERAQAREGDMTVDRIALVKNENVRRIGAALEIARHLDRRTGKGERENAAGEAKRVGDAFEAIVGAICQDAGASHASRVVERLLK